MAQIYGAFVLLSVYFSAALLILIFSPDLMTLSEIARTCNAAGFLDGRCQAAATDVAAQGLIALGMVIVVTIGFERKSLRDSVVYHSIEPFEASRGLTLLLLAAVAAVLAVHNARHEATGLNGQHYRAAQSALVSMENLAWPLLLQLTFWSRQVWWKIVFVAFLAAIAAVSPFRNAIFSMFYFGVAVPFGTMLIAGSSLSRRTRVLSSVATMALFLCASLIVLYQTGRRFESNEYQATPVPSRLALIELGLASRALTPFFQATLVDRLARSRQALPDFLASFEQKFQLGYQNLNEYVYKILYDGVGQTTTLYYGESAANTRVAPIFWDFGAPLALVLTYFLLRPICNVGILISIALWRSSMGGLFDVITALSLQLGFCLVLSYFHNRSNGKLAIATHKHEMA